MTLLAESDALARPAGPLRGSRIVGPPRDVIEDDEVAGFRLQVQLPRGMHAGHVEQQIPLIAAAYHTLPEAVRVLSVGDHSRCIVEVIQSRRVINLRVLRDERLHMVHPHIGPTLDPATGRWQVGVSIKDGTPVYGTLWTPGQGMRAMWIPGDPGGGKTAAMATSLLSVTGHGLVSPWPIDMQDGASLGEWRDVAPRWAGDVKAAREVLREANAVMDARSADMSRRNLKCLDPSPETPCVLLPVDEAPEIAGDRVCTGYVDRIARKGRKVLVQVWWANQMANGARGFASGNDGAILRGLLKSSNVMLFRSDSVTAKTAMGDFGQVDTTVIPVGVAGAMLFGGPAHPVPVLARALYEADPWSAVKRAVLPDIEAATRPVLERAETSSSVMSASEAEVYALFGDGVTVKTGDAIRALCGPGRLSVSTVKRALPGLADKGFIRSIKHGEWEKA